MIPVWQIHRNALFWLLSAFAAVIMVHAGHLPVWVLAAALFSMLWRVQHYRGVWSLPGRMVKNGLLAMCLAGLFLEYGKPVGLEPMVCLLISAYILKLLEMEHRRDALLVILLAFFVVAVQALFEQSIGSSVYILCCLSLVVAALVGLHQGNPEGDDSATHPFRPMKTSLVLLVQSLPLMLLLFIIMPRLGAFWSVPLQSHSARTGMSDQMSPGDFSQLGRSAEVAFRVSFKGDIPRQHQLYWRGVVLSDFDGRTWSSTDPLRYAPLRGGQGSLLQWFGQTKQRWDTLIERNGAVVDYNVILEATQQPWLFSLSTPFPKGPDVALTRDFRLLSAQPVTAKMQYDVRSWLDYRLSVNGLSAPIRSINLQLPQGFNPKSIALAQKLSRENNDELMLMQKVLSLYHQNFSYTLQPPLLNKHSVDEFLFETQKGFCEHFASSFVFLMRAAGIPARVVAGYQGGERHPDGYLVVRQYDAHAWAEVWINGRGWLRVDPTAAVAPERIELDLEAALSDDEAFLADSPISLVKFRHINWLNSLRLQLDAINYQWAKWVLGYDKVQRGLLEQWFGGYSPLKIAFLLLVIGGGLLGIVALWQLRHLFHTSHDELDKAFLEFCRKLAKAGITRMPGEGPRNYAERVAEARPELARQAKAISSAYEQMRYGNEGLKRLKTLRRAIKKIK